MVAKDQVRGSDDGLREDLESADMVSEKNFWQAGSNTKALGDTLQIRNNGSILFYDP